jgi:hypothetical protein
LRRKIVLATALLALVACDRGARKDLPQGSQNLDESTADIILMPDQFPNLAHKCLDTTGMWTVTDNWVWIVYNDRMCGGEGDMVVLDNIPGAQGGQE